MSKKCIFFLLILIFFKISFAQRYNFPDAPAEFVTYVSEQLKKNKRPEIDKVADEFSSLWNNLSANHTKIIAVSKKLANAKASMASSFVDFYAGLANSPKIKASSTQINDFLEVCEKATTFKDIKDLNTFLKKTRQFFENRAIEYTKTYRTYAPQGDFKFMFLEKADANLQAEFANNDSDSLAQATKELTGAMIKFSQTDLVLASSYDSVAVKNSKGIWLITKNIFVGKGGKFDWKSVNLDENKVFAELGVYTFDGSRNEIKGTNATFTHSDLLKKSIKGDFHFASRPRKNADYALFPKFISNDHNVEIPEISDKITYKGGFTLEGRKILSTSKQANQYSYLIGKSGRIDNQKQASFLISTRKLSITDSTISTNSAKFSLYMGESDSLYHSDLQLNYYRSSAQKKSKNYDLRLVRDKNTTSGITPFIDNHHEFYIDADVIRYNIEKDSLDLFMLTGSQDLRPAMFESFDFFDKDRYNQMIGLYNFHPLRLLGEYSRRNNLTTFTTAELAKDIVEVTKELAKKQGKKDVDLRNAPNEGILKNLAIDLKSKGYLDFDETTNTITMGKRISQSDSTDVFLNAVDKMQRKTAKKNDSTLYKIFDHDTFLIKSITKNQPNASMSRSNNELLIRGIDRFPISQILNVNVIPDTSKREVKIYKDRSLYLEKGEVTVGNFRFIGRQFFMLYDEFAVEMPIIDKILFIIADTTEDTKKVEFHEYGGEISFQPGRVVINDSKNKSGRKKGKILDRPQATYEEYPKLTIENGGLIYFKTKDRQNLAYDSLVVQIPQEFEAANDINKLNDKRGAVFILDPINMDSLTSKVPIFPGRFVSNILPTFKENLRPMPDYSMGFVHKAPKAGYPLYPISDKVKGAKIKFNRDLVMSKEALSTGGEISYLSTTLKSPEFILMPDSITSDNVEFVVERKQIGAGEYPEASGQTAQLRWNETTDEMIITNKEEITRLEDSRSSLPKGAFEQRFKDKLFTIYSKANPITLRGDLIIGADGLTGQGILVRKDFTIQSLDQDKIKFNLAGFLAKKIELRINSKLFDPYTFDQFFYANNKPIMHGNYVDVDFNFSKGLTDIKPNPDYIDQNSIEFPYAAYKTSISNALWDLNKQTITMSGDTNSRFTSTIFGSEENNPENLTFKANKAFYDIQNLTLLTSGIPYIYSADAIILPNKGEAVILKDAEMQDLKEARLFIDTTNRYHRLFNGTIRIKSKLDFEGDATYQFINVKKDTFNIKFDKFQYVTEKELAGDNIGKKKRKRKRDNKDAKFTYAEGTVEENDKKKFYITSRVLYKGKVKMYANRKDLGLEGFIKLDLESRKDFDQWLPYKSNKGDEVALEVEEKQKVDNNTITSGLHFSSGFDIYSTFLSPKPTENDQDIFLAKGILGYNPAINQFKIASQEKSEGKSFTGNLLIFDDSENSLYLEGKMNLFDKKLSEIVDKAGSVKIDNKNKKYNFDLLTTFNLPFSSKAINELNKILASKFSEKPLSLNANDPLNYKIAEIVGEKSYKSYTDDFKTGKIVNAWKDKEIRKTFVFSKVDMQWSEEFKTLYSIGKINLLSTGNKIWQIETPGYVEFKKSAEGDGFAFYIQPKPDFWLYAEYEKDKFYVLCSDEIINKNLKAKNLEVVGVDKKDAFINKFREVYKAESLPNAEEKKEEEPKKDDDKDKKKEEEKKKEENEKF